MQDVQKTPLSWCSVIAVMAIVMAILEEPCDPIPYVDEAFFDLAAVFGCREEVVKVIGVVAPVLAIVRHYYPVIHGYLMG